MHQNIFHLCYLKGLQPLSTFAVNMAHMGLQRQMIRTDLLCALCSKGILQWRVYHVDIANNSGRKRNCIKSIRAWGILNRIMITIFHECRSGGGGGTPVVPSAKKFNLWLRKNGKYTVIHDYGGGP